MLESADPARFAVNSTVHDADALPTVADNGTRVHWPQDAISRTLTVTDAAGGTIASHEVDVVFPILHGSWGEDGTVQGMLELVDLPYVGSGVLASALGMDKHFTKSMLSQAGIAVAPWRTVNRLDWQRDERAVRAAAAELGSSVFVKPARAGSSVGVSRVTEADDLGDALTIAFAEDDRVLIEAAVTGREVEIGVLGGGPGEPARASVAGEIVVTGRDFYDFAAKYLDAPGIELVCPARLTDDELARMQDLAVRAFDAIGCEGLARVDFFLTDHGFVVNEINTMPGFTPISMFPRCWDASGMGYPDLVDELVRTAVARHGR